MNTLSVGLTRARRFLTVYASAQRPSEFMARIEKQTPSKKAS